MRNNFSLGKRDTHTSVFLETPVAPEMLFSESSVRMNQARTIFFVCTSVSKSWLNELDVQNPSILFRQPSVVAERKEITSVWNRRLGTLVWNRRLSIEPFNKKRNSIRIAPMKGSYFLLGMLAKKVHRIRDCIFPTTKIKKKCSLKRGGFCIF